MSESLDLTQFAGIKIDPSLSRGTAGAPIPQ